MGRESWEAPDPPCYWHNLCSKGFWQKQFICLPFGPVLKWLLAAIYHSRNVVTLSELQTKFPLKMQRIRMKWSKGRRSADQAAFNNRSTFGRWRSREGSIWDFRSIFQGLLFCIYNHYIRIILIIEKGKLNLYRMHCQNNDVAFSRSKGGSNEQTVSLVHTSAKNSLVQIFNFCLECCIVKFPHIFILSV